MKTMGKIRGGTYYCRKQYFIGSITSTQLFLESIFLPWAGSITSVIRNAQCFTVCSSIIQEVAEKYLECGNPMNGFTRIKCSDCGKEKLLMFGGKGKRGRAMLTYRYHKRYIRIWTHILP